MAKKGNEAVFVDRDNTISKDVPYCSRPEDFELLPMAADGIRLLNENGFRVVIITNQSGISRGYFTEETLERIHHRMVNELAEEKAYIDGIYYCPHHPDENCNCRKPKPALILQAAHDLNIDLQSSFVVGDSDMDIEMGKRVGCSTILVSTEAGSTHPKAQADFTCPNLFTGAQWIISQVNTQGDNKR